MKIQEKWVKYRVPEELKSTLALVVLILLGLNFFSFTLPEIYSRVSTIKIFQPVYGPLPLKGKVDKGLDFFGVVGGFGQVPLERLKAIPLSQLENFILSSLNPKLRIKLREHLTETLFLAQKHQVDPFLILAIMWVESHFSSKVTSHLGARGLMQVLPGTAEFLVKINEGLDSFESEEELNHNTSLNIELGIVYIKRMLQRYRYNYKMAVMAYNMGPGTITNLKREGRSIGVRNNYLDKVSWAYHQLTKNIIRFFEKKTPPYQETFVVKEKWGEQHYLKLLSLLPPLRTVDAEHY